MLSKIVVGLLGLSFLITIVALAQPMVDPAVFEKGQRLYQDQCSLCHQNTGTGTPPIFPALNGNDQIGNPGQIINTIRRGASAMPPFPALSLAEIAAVATYIRNAWVNDFGAISTVDATEALKGSATSGDSGSVWDSVFTEVQVARGRAAYSSACGLCHGRRLNGAPDDPDMPSTPPLALARFLRTWDRNSLGTLFEYTRATMPQDNPGSLSDEEYVDVIAYMLSVSGMPEGEAELSLDLERLARIVITQQP